MISKTITMVRAILMGLSFICHFLSAVLSCITVCFFRFACWFYSVLFLRLLLFVLEVLKRQLLVVLFQHGIVELFAEVLVCGVNDVAVAAFRRFVRAGRHRYKIFPEIVGALFHVLVYADGVDFDELSDLYCRKPLSKIYSNLTNNSQT